MPNTTSLGLLLSSLAVAALGAGALSGCSAATESEETPPANPGGGGDDGIGLGCGFCTGNDYVPCDGAKQPLPPTTCAAACAPRLGCVDCVPGSGVCVGNEVHRCGADGFDKGALIEVCDTLNGRTCHEGRCATACEKALGSASNVGCEFWAVDLDQQDAMNDPASANWGVVLSNAGDAESNVTIEVNLAEPGAPLKTKVYRQFSVPPGSLQQVILQTRELDCGVRPNDYASPGTCLSSRAYKLTASAPIVVYQFNVFENTYSNDASLLLPTNALGQVHRVIGWGAGHPMPIDVGGVRLPVDRSYVTVVGTAPGTEVRVRPTWRIRGNAPIPATDPGGEIVMTLGPFDVLNLETDDAVWGQQGDLADLTGTVVTSDRPVAVFSGVESTAAPGTLEVPQPPDDGDGKPDTCCLDHLEEQIWPAEAIGSRYVVARSPVRSNTGFREPDVLRFLGVAEATTVKTTLRAPFDEFTLQPGQIVTTWTQDDVIVTSERPVMVGQLLVSQGYVDGPRTGDPSLTVFPPVDQFRTEYVILTPSSWQTNWVVISARVGSAVSLDGTDTSTCETEPSGTLDGADYESRRCFLIEGVHKLSGEVPFGIVAYGYGGAGSYAFVGGADVRKIYAPPPIPR